MLNTGFHPDPVWKSIIFQIVAGIYALWKNSLCLNGFNLMDNIYIKDLTGTGIASGYWKYIINSIDYYVPNYGYLILIDSKFKDLPPSDATLATSAPKHKIIGNIYEDKPTEQELKDCFINAFLNTINTNNFG